MTKFPLYDSLSKDISNKDLSVIQKRTFIKNVSSIDKNGCELIYALIKTFQIENKEENDINYSLPYKGEYNNNDIVFDLDNFPIKLKQILFKFVIVHLQKMKEEQTINKLTPGRKV